MWVLWILLLIATVSSLDVEITSTPDITTIRPSDSNITTLYPVYNKTIIRNELHTIPKDTETRSSYTEATASDTETHSNDTKMKVNETDTKSKPAHQSWKIESSFAPSNLTDIENNTTDSKEEKANKEIIKDFKPSQHLGSFFDDDSAEVINTPGFGLIGKKPISGLISSSKEEYHPTYNNIPKEIYQTHKQFPYKFEETVYTRTKDGWQEPMDSKPTVEVPVKVPAGGLYKSPDAFKEKPQNDEDFGLVYHEDEGKENAVKRRVNPWQNLLRLVTAFIPVGLIISALTPSVITIHNVDDNQPPSLPYRRSDPGVMDVSPISEQCRRRLLCELHSDRYYSTYDSSTTPRRKMKRCYKIHCEDTEALWKMLHWLFNYNQGAEDSRSRLIT